MSASGPIGVFDSGIGGLSVLREIRSLLPREDLLYVADSAHIPYGEKPAALIEERSVAVTRFLLAQGAKAVVVACNTASSAALTVLRARFALPIVGMEPAVKPAIQHTRSGVVGVLATSRTLASQKFSDLLARFGAGAEVHLQACPGWVERIETGDLGGAAVRALVERHLQPLLAKGVDTIVLGCTHYPFLRPLIQEIAGPSVAVIDPSPAVARQLRSRLEHNGLLAPGGRPGTAKFWTSAAPAEVERVLAQLWGEPVEVARLPESA